MNEYKLLDKLPVVDGTVVHKKVPSKFPKDTTVTMAYVPYQEDSETYALETALEAGTAFPCLDKPFLGGSEN